MRSHTSLEKVNYDYFGGFVARSGPVAGSDISLSG
jgi:hypothetical protein